MKKIAVQFLIFATLISCTSNNELERVSFMTGTWRSVNEGFYEHWALSANTLMEGESYRVKNEKMSDKDFLIIKKEGDNIVYEALALSQERGRKITYTLNPEVKDKLSFENLEEDFPSKIQYSKISDTEILIEVLGKDQKGFSSKMLKVK